MKEKSKFFVAMYLRLSRDDAVKTEYEEEKGGDGRSKAESNSIGSQRGLIRAFLNDQPEMELYDSYVDAPDIIGLKQNPTKRASL